MALVSKKYKPEFETPEEYSEFVDTIDWDKLKMPPPIILTKNGMYTDGDLSIQKSKCNNLYEFYLYAAPTLYRLKKMRDRCSTVWLNT